MTSHRPLRRILAALAAGLSVTLVPVAIGAPAHAADTVCLSEQPTGGLVKTRCDDASPPETAISATTPSLNLAGYVNTDHIDIDFAGSYSDADTDPITYKCRLDGPGSSDAGTWKACTSPISYTGLADSGSGAYTFSVYAIDSVDNGIDATQRPGLGGSAPKTDTPDYDLTPSTLTFRVDTTAPNVFVLTAPYDPQNPDLPMVTTLSPSFTLSATEQQVAYSCVLDGTALPCDRGVSTFRNLSPGDKTLVVGGTDIAGNADPTPTTVRFAVPTDLGSAVPGWTLTQVQGYLGGTVLSTKRTGATLQVASSGASSSVTEIRLIADLGPKAGKVSVRAAEGPRYTVDLHRAQVTKHAVIVVRGRFSKPLAGPVTITVLSTGRRVAIDGVLAH